MDATALADFLHRRRDALQPESVGLPRGPRRRVPGLRREEVAQLTGMSVDYYTRIEQRRGPQPSRQMLTAMARALQLSPDERDHLFRLAGHPAPERPVGSTGVTPAVLRVLDQMTDMAAFVVSDLEVVLAANPLAIVLLGLPVDPSGDPFGPASSTWHWFTDPAARAVVPPEDHAEASRIRVADLRAVWSRRRGDADVDALVDRLCTTSGEFAALWSDHEVSTHHPDHKQIRHPAIGVVEVDCEILAMPAVGHALVLLSATPGSEDDDKLRLVAMELHVTGPSRT